MAETQVQRQQPPVSKAKSKKRPRNDEITSRKRRKQAYEEEEEYLDLEAGVNKKISMIDSLLLADHYSKKIRRFGTELKPVELSQLDISRMLNSSHILSKAYGH